MALPTSYESVSPAAARRPARSRVVRVVAGTAAVLALTALVALVGQSTEQARRALLSKDHELNTLALDFLKHGAQMSVQDIQTQLAAFTKSPNVAELKFPTGDGRAMMLAAVPRKATQKLQAAEGGHPPGICMHPAVCALPARCVREVTCSSCRAACRRRRWQGVAPLPEEGHHHPKV
jgi:hypothetical protein